MLCPICNCFIEDDDYWYVDRCLRCALDNKEQKYTFTEFMKKFFPDYLVQKKYEIGDLCKDCSPLDSPLCSICLGC